MRKYLLYATLCELRYTHKQMKISLLSPHFTLDLINIKPSLSHYLYQSSWTFISSASMKTIYLK